MIRVLVNGALGRMGSEVCKKVYSEADLELVGAVDIKEGTVPLGDGVKVTTDLVAAIEAAKPDVVVDFTRPDVVMGAQNAAAWRACCSRHYRLQRCRFKRG